MALRHYNKFAFKLIIMADLLNNYLFFLLKNNDKNSGILRFGSLSVKVKKTTEAFNNYFGARSTSSDSLSMPYIGSGGTGSNSFATREDANKMPPPRYFPMFQTHS